MRRADGNTEPDAPSASITSIEPGNGTGTADFAFQLRAERKGNGVQPLRNFSHRVRKSLRI